jgi:hypothetical protein
MSIRAVTLAVLTAFAVAADAHAAGDVATYPEPGSRYASAFTSLTFAGAGAAALEGVEVTGAETGTHTGRIRKLREGRGAIFEPDEPFRPGERVTVRSRVPVLGGGRSYWFRTARFVAPAQRRWAAARARAADAPSCELKRRRFRTLRGFRPPAMCTSVARGAHVSPGRLLVTPRPRDRDNGQWGAAIVSTGGKLLWYSPESTTVNDLKVVTVNGERLLALFHRPSEKTAYHELLNRHYKPVARITAGNGYRVDSHELQFTTHGTIYVGIYNPVLLEGRKVIDYVVQELDGRTRDVLFEWHSLDHVPVSASYRSRVGDASWDYFHGNSIEPPGGTGTILVSARNTSSVYGIDRRTGNLRWTLSGKYDDFGVVERHPRWQFCAQHDARRLRNGDIMLFDNGSTYFRHPRGSCPSHAARVLQFRIDPAQRDARVVRSISSRVVAQTSDGYRPYAVGSAREQPDGNLLISWGTSGRVTEVTPAGDVAFRLALGEREGETGNWSYRAVRDEWDGFPLGRPAIEARRRRDGGVDVWASWNGATEIARWRVLAGDVRDGLEPAGEFGFADLETLMRPSTEAGHVAVQALDATGKVLGQSLTARVR